MTMEPGEIRVEAYGITEDMRRLDPVDVDAIDKLSGSVARLAALLAEVCGVLADRK